MTKYQAFTPKYLWGNPIAAIMEIVKSFRCESNLGHSERESSTLPLDQSANYLLQR